MESHAWRSCHSLYNVPAHFIVDWKKCQSNEISSSMKSCLIQRKCQPQLVDWLKMISSLITPQNEIENKKQKQQDSWRFLAFPYMYVAILFHVEITKYNIVKGIFPYWELAPLQLSSFLIYHVLALIMEEKRGMCFALNTSLGFLWTLLFGFPYILFVCGWCYHTHACLVNLCCINTSSSS